MKNDKITNQTLSKLNLKRLYKLIKRKNIGNDFGAWSDTILEYNLQNKYKYPDIQFRPFLHNILKPK